MLLPSPRDVRRPRTGPALLPVHGSPSWGEAGTAAVLERCLARWRRYEAATVDPEVSAHDDMLVDTPEGRAHYRGVGLSALRLITEAMLLSGRTDPTRILDLPCGGGRVTRHLVTFFPEAEIAVADLDARKVADVVAQFGVRAIESSPDFSAPLPGSYDLIFVGSLVTHFDAALFARATNVMIDALAPGGVLVLTSAGRNWAALSERQDRDEGLVPLRWWRAALSRLGGPKVSYRLRALEGDYARHGFGYSEVRSWTKLYGQSYGGSYAAPSWLMRVVEERTDALVLGFKERGFDDLLDATLIQRAG
ncbi:class I SAM-dependent methyltransferase [Methylobacterium nonmethylotrophicum]|nr:class I SAM-dependent methyltransferase [Methylobacterium nonmethylotrophicum]